MMRKRDDARSAAAVDIGICQYRRKRPFCRHFLNSHSHDRTAIVVALSRRRYRNAARRGLRVANFGNEKIFVGKTLFASFQVVKAWFEHESRLGRFGRTAVIATTNGGCEAQSQCNHAPATTPKRDVARA
ncbi:hypothetical protein MTX23_15760 [Bradyrhizobium sp. ISRA436]|uniref:hypothetical protein n=1 Tax=unclassified Bradyrhizobium TaxID=2631580 RepID=UPI002479BC32|nr:MULTISPECIES: hypothetical protein [unclassified Bradyrhizobium]WGS02182.1 hypothetical protein MTX23_15760 [Bradyrhizobium sp. ISRA436]WGS09067.1 hypothetical protein MTX18_15750 [Bradyrhizobium sp. ISRA437]